MAPSSAAVNAGSALPTEFAVFPLSGALLLPHGKMPLNVFEPRYMRMVDDALASNRVIGMIQEDEIRPSTPSGPALYRVGCLGRLSSFSETDDGRYLITLTGLTRFWVQVELELHRGYRRVRADLSRYAADLQEPESSEIDRERLLTALRGYFQARGFDANWDAIDAMPDGDLVRTLSMICPFEPPEKQALLEATAQPDQADTLITLLEMGMHDIEVDPPTRRAT
ncbi:MAG: LON peptidase substrate-binding domain-containing protein [Janthinobacterium lividum]